MPTILIAGAGGYLGARLAAALNGTHRIIGLFRAENARVERLRKAGVQMLPCELSDLDDVDRSVREDVEIIVNCAAVIPSTDSTDRDILSVNVRPQENLLEVARRRHCCRFIYCSSISVYEGLTERAEDASLSPRSAYGIAKLQGEGRLAEACGQGIESGVSLRFAGIHGGDRTGGVVYHMLQALRNGRPLIIAEPDSRFRFCFVDDAVAAIAACLDADIQTWYVCYNVASRDAYSLRELAQTLMAVAGIEGRIAADATGPVRSEVMPIDRILSETTFRPEGLEHCLRRLLSEVIGSQTCA